MLTELRPDQQGPLLDLADVVATETPETVGWGEQERITGLTVYLRGGHVLTYSGDDADMVYTLLLERVPDATGQQA